MLSLRLSRLKRPSNRTSLAIAALLLLCIGLFFWQLGSHSVFNITEAKQAEIARQIWVRQDWITPVYNTDEIYFDKPILLHWLMALGYGAWGLNEWAVRFPSAIAATALILSTWFFVRCFTNHRVALLTATMLAINPLTFGLGRMGQHDMLLTAFTTGALYCWYWAYRTRQTWSYLAFFALLGLAVMAKGPLGLVICGLVIAVFLTVIGGWRAELAAVPWGWGLLIFGAIALPWYLAVILANGWTFADHAFLGNNVDRFLSPNQDQSGPWYYYLPVMLIAFFPWLILLPSLGLKHRRDRWLDLNDWRQRSPDRQLGLFMTVWSLSILIFMSLAATKLPWYVYPGFPALAYLCAQAWEQQIQQPSRWLPVGLGLIALMNGALAIALWLSPRWIEDVALVQVIQTSGIGGFWPLLFAIAAILIALAALKQKALWAWWVSLMTFMVFTLSAVTFLLPPLDQAVLHGRLMPIAETLRQATCDACGDEVVAFGVNEPSLNFYSRLSHIERFQYGFQLQAELLKKSPQRLIVVAQEDALARSQIDLNPDFLVQVADDFKLFIVPRN